MIVVDAPGGFSVPTWGLSTANATFVAVTREEVKKFGVRHSVFSCLPSKQAAGVAEDHQTIRRLWVCSEEVFFKPLFAVHALFSAC
jgi:hypothetical protein